MIPVEPVAEYLCIGEECPLCSNRPEIGLTEDSKFTWFGLIRLRRALPAGGR